MSNVRYELWAVDRGTNEGRLMAKAQKKQQIDYLVGVRNNWPRDEDITRHRAEHYRIIYHDEWLPGCEIVRFDTSTGQSRWLRGKSGWMPMWDGFDPNNLWSQEPELVKGRVDYWITSRIHHWMGLGFSRHVARRQSFWERNRRIVHLRELGLTLREVGEVVGLSIGRVLQVLEREERKTRRPYYTRPKGPIEREFFGPSIEHNIEHREELEKLSSSEQTLQFLELLAHPEKRSEE